MNKLTDKKIIVVGLGRSGYAAAKFLRREGCFVKATDSAATKDVLRNAGHLSSLGVAVETGGHSASFVKEGELFVTSPGVAKSSRPLAYAKHCKIPVISEVELASYFCKGALIGITGSNGKTTTSHLAHRILEGSRRRCVLCGNVGYSFVEALPQIDAKTTVLLELSSFQLEDIQELRPKVAVILNVSPNHLNRHKTFRNYVRAKRRIFKNQKKGDFLILNYDDTVVRKMAGASKAEIVFFSKRPLREGVFLQGGRVVVKHRRVGRFLLTIGKMKLKGEHNLENAMAAVAVCALLGVKRSDIQRGLNAFKTLEHRIEPVGRVRGISIINDSKSTTIESTQAALRAVAPPVILIAGGRDKGADFSRIEPLLKERVKKAILYGEARFKMAGRWGRFKRYALCGDFREAVRLAFESSRPGDSLLLSPMCASFDQFSSFEERGEVFKKLVKEFNKR